MLKAEIGSYVSGTWLYWVKYEVDYLNLTLYE